MSEKVLLKNLVNIDSGFAFKSSLFTEYEQYIPIIRIRDVNSGVATTYYSGEYDEKYIVNNGDLLISMDGSFIIKKWTGGKALLNQRVCRIKSISEKITDDYLFRILPKELKVIEDKTPFVTVKHLSVKSIENIEINLPNLKIQKKIVEVLDKAQELIDKRKEQIEALDELVKSRFIEMFGDPNLNHKGWTKLSWEYIFNTTTGKLDSNAMVEDGKYPFFTCAKERFWIDKYDFDCEALLLAGNNAAGVYDVKHYSGKFNAYQRTYVLTLKNEDYSYILFKHQLENKLSLLKHQSKGSNTRYLTMGILKELEFIAPPIELQNQFTDLANKVGKLKFNIETSLKDLQDNFNSLMQKAFKGELF